MSTPEGSGWRLLPPERVSSTDERRILLIESYGAGSHMRTARLFQQHSRHCIDIVKLPRDHWRSIAFTGHRQISAALGTLDHTNYDMLLFSGPADIRLALPESSGDWRDKPAVAYFHESQWTYPAPELDRTPHLINHLETLEYCDAIWFNSRFHRDTFYHSARTHPSRMVQDLACQIIPTNWRKTAVVYPPVDTLEQPTARSTHITLSWSARWEAEKRPDLLLAIVRECLRIGIDMRLHILGCRPERWQNDPNMDEAIRSVLSPLTGFLPRAEYEAALASSDVWLSTAEHEFFGISAIEATLLGATPVVPSDLAYRETLPSAVTYPAGDVAAAAQRIRAVADADRPLPGAWRQDARRFRAAISVTKFDAEVDALLDR